MPSPDDTVAFLLWEGGFTCSIIEWLVYRMVRHFPVIFSQVSMELFGTWMIPFFILENKRTTVKWGRSRSKLPVDGIPNFSANTTL